MTSPLEEAAHLRRVAAEIAKENPPEEGKPSAAIQVGLTSALRAVMYEYEADGLERGYLRGRAMAAHDVRLGLDEIERNGSVHFDSDISPPPAWIVHKAERLARGDA